MAVKKKAAPAKPAAKPSPKPAAKPEKKPAAKEAPAKRQPPVRAETPEGYINVSTLAKQVGVDAKAARAALRKAAAKGDIAHEDGQPWHWKEGSKELAKAKKILEAERDREKGEFPGKKSGAAKTAKAPAKKKGKAEPEPEEEEEEEEVEEELDEDEDEDEEGEDDEDEDEE